MLTLQSGIAARGLTRRATLKAGFLGVAGLALPDYLRAKAEPGGSHPPLARSSQKSVILIWLDGGSSQLETFDPKPDAAAEFRGPFGVRKTRTPGVVVSELMPNLADRFSKYSIIRSLHHDNGDHFAAAHWMTTGRFGSTSVSQAQKYPSVGSIVSKVRGTNKHGLPAYVGLPSAETVYLFPGYMGAAYLGGAYNPFDVDRESKYLGAFGGTRVRSPKWLSNLGGTKEAVENTVGKTSLLKQFDTMRRDIDQSGIMTTMDKYQQQALELVMGSEARVAFDIDKEDPKSTDRYGPSPWGQYAMMARRLVEAGVTFVSVDMPHWDDHSSLVQSHAPKIRVVDKIVSALLDDLEDRGLLDSTLVCVMGEFGRTPRINTGQPGIPIPGRDHWGNAISVLLAGGGITPGVVVGKTNERAEHPVERALKPEALLATIYHQLGIDANETFKDHSGRPVPIVDDPTPIKELV